MRPCGGLADLIRSANGAFFAGGDQSRITRALRHQDGSNTRVLDALGLGIDEDTAMVVLPNRDVEVIGYRGALVLDLANATEHAGAFNVSDVRVSYLDSGDRFNIATREFTHPGTRPTAGSTRRALIITSRCSPPTSSATPPWST